MLMNKEHQNENGHTKDIMCDHDYALVSENYSLDQNQSVNNRSNVKDFKSNIKENTSVEISSEGHSSQNCNRIDGKGAVGSKQTESKLVIASNKSVTTTNAIDSKINNISNFKVSIIKNSKECNIIFSKEKSKVCNDPVGIDSIDLKKDSYGEALEIVESSVEIVNDDRINEIGKQKTGVRSVRNGLNKDAGKVRHASCMSHDSTQEERGTSGVIKKGSQSSCTELPEQFVASQRLPLMRPSCIAKLDSFKVAPELDSRMETQLDLDSASSSDRNNNCGVVDIGPDIRKYQEIANSNLPDNTADLKCKHKLDGIKKRWKEERRKLAREKLSYKRKLARRQKDRQNKAESKLDMTDLKVKQVNANIKEKPLKSLVKMNVVKRKKVKDDSRKECGNVGKTLPEDESDLDYLEYIKQRRLIARLFGLKTPPVPRIGVLKPTQPVDQASSKSTTKVINEIIVSENDKEQNESLNLDDISVLNLQTCQSSSNKEMSSLPEERTRRDENPIIGKEVESHKKEVSNDCVKRLSLRDVINTIFESSSDSETDVEPMVSVCAAASDDTKVIDDPTVIDYPIVINGPILNQDPMATNNPTAIDEPIQTNDPIKTGIPSVINAPPTLIHDSSSIHHPTMNNYLIPFPDMIQALDRRAIVDPFLFSGSLVTSAPFRPQRHPTPRFSVQCSGNSVAPAPLRPQRPPTNRFSVQCSESSVAPAPFRPQRPPTVQCSRSSVTPAPFRPQRHPTPRFSVQCCGNSVAPAPLRPQRPRTNRFSVQCSGSSVAPALFTSQRPPAPRFSVQCSGSSVAPAPFTLPTPRFSVQFSGSSVAPAPFTPQRALAPKFYVQCSGSSGALAPFTFQRPPAPRFSVQYSGSSVAPAPFTLQRPPASRFSAQYSGSSVAPALLTPLSPRFSVQCSGSSVAPAPFVVHSHLHSLLKASQPPHLSNLPLSTFPKGWPETNRKR